MAKLNSWFPFTGTFGDLSFYKMKGSDKIIARRKGGHSKQRIKNSPEFENTRRVNAEFGGRSTATGCIATALGNQKALVDFRIYGEINSMLRLIQKMDTENDLGKRSVLITKNPGILEGLNLNTQTRFDSIVKTPCKYTASRESIAAQIMIPGLVPGINFYVPVEFPMFRFTAQFGMLPDLFYTENGYQPAGPFYNYFFPVAAQSEWYPCMTGSPALTLELELPSPVPADSCSLMLSVGICFGNIGNGNNIFQQKHVGAAKILTVV